jgi:hypothetical protein
MQCAPAGDAAVAPQAVNDLERTSGIVGSRMTARAVINDRRGCEAGIETRSASSGLAGCEVWVCVRTVENPAAVANAACKDAAAGIGVVRGKCMYDGCMQGGCGDGVPSLCVHHDPRRSRDVMPKQNAVTEVNFSSPLAPPQHRS